MTADGSGWQRLRPAAILDFAVSGLLRVVWHGWQGFLPVIAGLSLSSKRDHLLVVLGGLAAIVLALVAIGAVTAYLVFRYRLGSGEFEVRKGLLNRTSLSLSLDRVQSVSIDQPAYFRPFGLVKLKLESAGSAGQEVSLPGVDRAFAQQVRQAVTETPMAGHAHAPAEPVQRPASEPQPLIRLQAGDLIRHGIASDNNWLFAALFGSVFGAMGQNAARLFEGLEGPLAALLGQGWLLGILVGGAALLFVLGAIVLLSVVSAIILFHNFQLIRLPQGFRRRCGLLETRESVLLDSKVQCMTVRQSWAALLMQRHAAEVVQVSHQGPSQSGQTGLSDRFLVPGLTAEGLDAIIAPLFPGVDWRTMTLTGIDRSYVWKRVQFIGLVPAGLAALGLWPWAGVWALAVLIWPVLLIPVYWRRCQRYRCAMADGYGLVQSGFLGRQQTLFPIDKVQAVRLSQSPFQRRHRLANLTVELAGRHIVVPFMPLGLAQSWVNRLLYAAETSTRPWM